MTVTVFGSAPSAGTSYGKASPSGVSAHIKSHTAGAMLWSELVASTPARAVGILLTLYDSAGDARHVIDIAFGAVGAEVVKIPNIYKPVTNAEMLYRFPLEIPAGTRISFSSQSSSGSRPSFVGLQFIYDDRFEKGTLPTSYTAYNLDVSGSATALDSAGTVTAGGTDNTDGSYVDVIPTLPSGCTHVVLGTSNGVFNKHNNVDVATSPDGATWTDIISDLIFWSSGLGQPRTFPVQGIDGLHLGMKMRSTTASNTRNFPVYIGTNGVAGADGVIVHQDNEMQSIVRGSATASQRRFYFDVWKEDGKTPWDGSNTGKKAKWKANGSSSEVTSTNDIVRVDTETAAHYVELDVSETNALAVDDRVIGYVPASAGNHLVAPFKGIVFEAPFTGAAEDVPSDTENATAVVAALKADAEWSDLSVVQSDLDNIQTRLPAALVSGRMDASVGALEAGAITAIRDGILNWVVFTGYSLARMLRVLFIVIRGTKTGSGTNSEVFTAPAGGATVTMSSIDDSGDRTAMADTASGTP